MVDDRALTLEYDGKNDFTSFFAILELEIKCRIIVMLFIYFLFTLNCFEVMFLLFNFLAFILLFNINFHQILYEVNSAVYSLKHIGTMVQLGPYFSSLRWKSMRQKVYGTFCLDF